MGSNLFIVIAIIVLCVLVYAGFVFQRISHARQIGLEIAAKALPFEQTVSDPRMRVLVAGDSTGVGTGSADPKDSIAGRLGSTYPTADIKNISVNGLRLSGLATILLSVKDQHFDLIVLQIGANDVIAFTPLSEVRSALVRVLTQATVLGDHVIVLTAGNIGSAPVFSWPLSSIYTFRTRQVRDVFMEVLSLYPKTTYVDLFKEAADEPFSKNVSLYYAPDHFHPSGAGYGLWFVQIKPILPR